MGPGEIHLGYFPFGGRLGRKLRPVLLLTGPVGPVPEVLAAYMTSVVSGTLLATDLVIDPALPQFAGTNLRAVTLLRLHKLATIHHGDVTRRLGTMPAAAMIQVETRLRSLLNL
jgi:hypothetical protein